MIGTKLEFSDNDIQLIRLAGLLHDLGHYPLSHVGESAYMNIKVVDNPINEQREKVKSAIAGLGQIRLGDYMKQSSNPKHHERITEKVILTDGELKRIIQEECPYIDIQDICDIITGCVDRKPELSSKVQIMHSIRCR
jgi:HD superfamily phosphohydrolase